MYHVNEYVQESHAYTRFARHLGLFPTLEDARGVAETAYRERQPKTAPRGTFIGVTDDAGNVVYARPVSLDR